MANEKVTEKEFEKKVLELAKQKLTAEKIGEKLKRQTGVINWKKPKQ